MKNAARTKTQKQSLAEREREVCRLWVNRDFSNIPGALVERAFKDMAEDLQLLAGGLQVSNCCDNAEIEFVHGSDIDPVCPTCNNCCLTHWSGPEYGWPAAWGTMFHPSESFDEEWVRNNADAVARLGFLVYDSDETGILLGVDGAGYDFYDQHWLPLYRLRGLKWHESK